MTTTPSTPSRGCLHWLVRFPLLAVIDGYALALVIYLPLRLLVGDGFWALAALNNLAPYTFLPLLVALPLALLLRARHALLLTVPLAVIGLVWFGPYFLPKTPPTADGPTLRIVTFNVWGDNLRLDDVEAWLREVDADLVLIQEIPPRYADGGVPALADLYPHQIGQPTALRLYGQLTLSRYPVLAAENLDMEGDGAPTQQRLVIDAPGGPVVVYNVHFLMPVREGARFHLPVDFWPLGMAARYDAAGRDDQINRLLDHVAAETDPVIVAGDFNMSDQAVMYGSVAARLGDSFREVGIGLGASWPVPVAAELPDWLPPVFRLDYVWHGDGLCAVEAWVGPRLGSDHLPHVATLALTPPQPDGCPPHLCPITHGRMAGSAVCFPEDSLHRRGPALTTNAPAPARPPLSSAARANIILLLSVFAFGFTAVFARWADAPGLIVAAGRAAVAAIVLAVPYARQPAERRRLSPALARRVVFSAVIFAIGMALFHVALDFSTAANVTFLGNLAPLWVGVLTLFVLRRTLPRLFWPGLAVAGVGAALIVFGDGGLAGIHPGDLIVLGSSFFWASYVVLTGEARARVSALTWVWPVVTLSAVLLIGLALLLGIPLTGYGPQTALAILGSGIFSQAMGFIGFNYVLDRVPPARATVTNMLQPVITAIAAALLLGEAFGGWRLVGGALILAGIYLVNRPDPPAETGES